MSNFNAVNNFAKLSFATVTKNSTISTCYSPLSIAYGSLMLERGITKGKARDQFTKIFGEMTNDEIIALLQQLKSANAKICQLANAIFVREGCNLLEDYLTDISTLGRIENVTFPDAIMEINSWVSDNTFGKIQDLLSESDFTSDTQIAIINALYFKANWYNNFNENRTRKAKFTKMDGSNIEVDMMYNSDEYGMYYEDDLVQVYEKPFHGEACMGFILPKQSKYIYPMSKNNNNINLLNLDNLDYYIKHMNKTCVQPLIPKFKQENRFNLVDVFKELGIDDIFREYDANLLAMSNESILYVDQIMHRAIVEIDENGSEAAAVTVIRYSDCRYQPESIVFRADHTFVWYIRNNKNDSIIFCGLQDF